MSQSPIETRTAATESGDHPISQAVVETVADAENVDPIDIEVPLFDVVDPDDVTEEELGLLMAGRGGDRADPDETTNVESAETDGGAQS